jgi:hypothetical protein
LAATERDEEQRSAWRERLKGVDPRRLVFVDESSTNVDLTPRYARAPRGGKGTRQDAEELGQERNADLFDLPGRRGASMSIKGSSDTESFGLYLRELLCPRLKAGQIVVIDNLSVHRCA